MSKKIEDDEVAEDFIRVGKGARANAQNLQKEGAVENLDQNIQQGKRKASAQKENDKDIAEEIRQQIILKQMYVLRDDIAYKTQDNAEKTKIQNLKDAELKAFINSPENREKVSTALNDKEVQQMLRDVEVAGHKYIQDEFKKDFKDIQWESGPQTDTRVNVIKDEDGNKICDLTEKTIRQNPVTITLADGSDKVVSSYRSIDFPQSLDASGPMDLAIAVKDVNGKNIAANKAVYFTAHYDDAGKLTEVSTPMPLKFMGEGKDAIGYIERDGEIYTLPVTKGKYQEMMQEVAKNNGMSMDLSQTVKMVDRAADQYQLQPKSPMKSPEIPPPPGPMPENWKKGQKPQPQVNAIVPPVVDVPEVVPPSAQAEVGPGKIPAPPGLMPENWKKGQKPQPQVNAIIPPVVEVPEVVPPSAQAEAGPGKIPVPPGLMPENWKPGQNKKIQQEQADSLPPLRPIPEIPKPQAVVPPSAQAEAGPGKIPVPPGLMPENWKPGQNKKIQQEQAGSLPPLRPIPEIPKPQAKSDGPPLPPPIADFMKKNADSKTKPDALETPGKAKNSLGDDKKPQPNNLLDQIKGEHKLKKVDPELVKPVNEKPQPSSLLDQIKGERKLKKVDLEQIKADKKLKEEENKPQGMAGAFIEGFKKIANAMNPDQGKDEQKNHDPEVKKIIKEYKDIDADNGRDQAVELLSKVITSGKIDHVKALVEKAEKSDDWKYKYTPADLKNAYDNGIKAMKGEKNLDVAKQIHKAAGTISKDAGITAEKHVSKLQAHEKNITPTKGRG
jgi:hypothetical protein